MVSLYATSPQSKDVPTSDYVRVVADAARSSERAGCTGILIYTDNGIVDPWLVSQVVIASTDRIHPLVAVQPVYMHPFSMAKMVTSLSCMYGRQIHLNMLAGGFRNDLLALGDATPHDERYARTEEYTAIAMGLLRGAGPVSVDGRYYRVDKLALTPPLPPDLVPEVLMSGSSPAGVAAAHRLGATPVRYPQPPGADQDWTGAEVGFGVRVGVIARETADQAWRVARERFPEDRRGQVIHRLATGVSDSHWHHQLALLPEHGDENEFGEPDPYWLGPFQNYRTFCPYLVGSHRTVGRTLNHYMSLGAETFILDIAADEADLDHTCAAFAMAQDGAVFL